MVLGRRTWCTPSPSTTSPPCVETKSPGRCQGFGGDFRQRRICHDGDKCASAAHLSSSSIFHHFYRRRDRHKRGLVEIVAGIETGLDKAVPFPIPVSWVKFNAMHTVKPCAERLRAWARINTFALPALMHATVPEQDSRSDIARLLEFLRVHPWASVVRHPEHDLFRSLFVVFASHRAVHVIAEHLQMRREGIDRLLNHAGERLMNSPRSANVALSPGLVDSWHEGVLAVGDSIPIIVDLGDAAPDISASLDNSKSSSLRRLSHAAVPRGIERIVPGDTCTIQIHFPSPLISPYSRRIAHCWAMYSASVMPALPPCRRRWRRSGTAP
ncbi:hypothetical protein HMPREF1223_12332 [Pseudomonas aeruginosa str. Stone 130]|nr:hypothetical protein HMPREF1223_12332 [Pseudomonas aeruginosa str. Stone 130]